MKIRHQSAFSLVEVVIAIGIISFALLTILSLMVSSLKSDRNATDDTVLPAMADATLAYLRSYYATNALPTSAVTNNFYFNSAGTLQTNTSGVPISSNDANSLYLCKVAITTNGFASTNMKILRLDFYRPPSNTNSDATLHASLSKE
jgi:uncharacterized protein (TIGR02598 family)